MNLEKAKQEFIKYTNNYDIKNPKIEKKIGHSKRVMEISREIAENLELSPKQVEVATLIGLLHDIGRFDQIKIYDTFVDHMSIDHGDLGVEILETNNFIRKFIEEDKYDKIILKAIKNHNKYGIEEGLTDEENMFAKIIKDADKLDILYEGAYIYWSNEEERKEIEQSISSEKIFNEYNKKKLIDKSKLETHLDKFIWYISLIFDVNFKYSYKILQNEDYIEKILNRFNFESNSIAKEQIQKVKKIAREYIESKI